MREALELAVAQAKAKAKAKVVKGETLYGQLLMVRSGNHKTPPPVRLDHRWNPSFCDSSGAAAKILVVSTQSAFPAGARTQYLLVALAASLQEVDV